MLETGTGTNPRHHRLVCLTTLALLVLDLLVVQLHSFRWLKLEAAARGLEPSASSVLVVLRLHAGASVWIPFVLAAMLVAALVVLQWRTRAVSRLLASAVETRRGALMLTFVLVVVGVRYYADAGLPHQYDAKLHVMRVAEVARLLASGEGPDWTFTWYGGFPLLRFSGPLYYLLAAVASLLLGSVGAGVKLVLVLAHVGGAFAVFGLVRELGGSRRAAVLGGVGSALSFQHTSAIVLAGRQPVALLYVVFPLLLLAGERLVRRPGPISALRFGLFAALLVLTHPGLASYGVLAAVLFVVIRAVGRARRAKDLLPPAASVAAAGLVAAVLVAGLVLPALLEREHVHVSRMYASSASGFSIDWTPDLLRIGRVLVWSAAFGGSVTYVGLTLLLLAGFAVLRADISRNLAVALGGCGLVLLFLVGGSYFSQRSVHFLVPLVAVAAGLAVDRIDARFFPLVLVLVVLDLGLTTIQSPFRPDLEYDRAFVADVARDEPGRRALRLSLRRETWDTSEFATAYDSGLPLVTGPFREGASREQYPWILDLLARLRDDMNADGRPGEATLLGCRALGAELILAEDGAQPVLPAIDAEGLRPRPGRPGLEVEGAGPAVAVLDRADLERLRDAGEASWSVALGLAPDTLRNPDASGISLLERDLGARHVRLRVRADRDGLLLLAFPWLPGVRLRVDGHEAPVERGPFGLIATPVETGQHDLELRFEAPPHLALSRAMSTIALALAVLFLVGWALRRRSSSDEV